MTRLYNKNLLFFKNGTPVLYNSIVSGKPLYQTEIEKVQGQFNYILKNGEKRCFVHSIYNIDREIEEAFKDTNKDARVVILFGVGAGYYLPHIKNNFPHLEHLIIVEPNLNFFREMLKFVDYEELNLSIKSIMFLINREPEDAISFLIGEFNKYSNAGVEIISHLPYRTMYEGYFEFLYNKLVENLRHTTVNTLTFKVINNRDTVNFFNNIRIKSLEFERISSVFRGKPAILVSAGPSLNKNMHLLKGLEGKAIIVAVGSAIKILHNNGIVPHFRVAVDGGENEMKIFEDIDTSNSILLYSNSLYYKILPEYKGPKINFVLDTLYLEQYLRKKTGKDTNIIRSGFSVANIAFDLLCSSGCSKVIIIGQDLCYTNGYNYAKGSWENEKIDFSGKAYIKEVDIFGDEVYTTKAYLGMKGFFERFYAIHKHIPVVNATEGGLNIEGIKNSILEEEIGALNKIEELETGIQKIYEVYSSFANQEFEEYIDIFSRLEADFDGVMEISKGALREIKRLQRYKKRNVARYKILKDLEMIRDLEGLYSENEIALEVVLPMLEQLIQASDLVYGYYGEDEKNKIDSLEKVDLFIIKEICDYAQLIRECLQFNLEYKKDVAN